MEKGREYLDGAQDLSGIGRMAYLGGKHGLQTLQFWDDDTPCYVTVTTALDRDSAIALGRDLAVALAPATIAN
jgi:hypothetical protein